MEYKELKKKEKLHFKLNSMWNNGLYILGKIIFCYHLWGKYDWTKENETI